MAPRLPEFLIGAEDEMVRIHRRVVRVGAASAWAATAIYLIAGFLSRSPHLFTQSIGPIVAAVLMTSLVLLKKENAVVAMVGSGLVVMLWVVADANEDTLLAAAVALVVICAISTLFVARRHRVVMATVGIGLFTSPQLWSLSFSEALVLGTVMSLSFFITSVIFTTVRDAAATLNVRFKMLFEHSPTAVMEEDWSEALAYIRSEYTGRPERIRPFLMAYPEVVRRAVSKAKINRVNPAAVTLLEADRPGDLLGYRDGHKVTAETLASFVDSLVALYEGMTLAEQELPALTMKGRPIWLQARSVDSSSGRAGSTILVGLADITHIKARQEAMAELVRSKDEFIARVSHELRTPLTAVVGLTKEMTDESSLSPNERAELMHLVAGQAEEMADIVEDLLVASRVESGNISIQSEVVNLKDALEFTLRGMATSFDETPSSTPLVFADPSRLRQILRNLITNAERYGGSKRRVVSGYSGTKAWLEVRDDGHGVPQTDVARIFEPYATSHRGVSGSVGLGLSVARQLAQLMGGDLSYLRDGDETVFRLELPFAGMPETVMSGSGTGI